MINDLLCEKVILKPGFVFATSVGRLQIKGSRSWTDGSSVEQTLSTQVHSSHEESNQPLERLPDGPNLLWSCIQASIASLSLRCLFELLSLIVHVNS